MRIRFFDELTGIRAVAAYLVFFHHFNVFSEKQFGGFIHGFVNEFHIGVTIFFVLSGFLICHRYYDTVMVSDKKWLVRYLQNRIARIYPMYFLLTTLTFAIGFMHSESIQRQAALYLSNITFLRGFFDTYKFSGIAQGWSLTVEECFYLSAPAIFVISKRRKLFLPYAVIFSTGIILVAIFRNVDFYGFFGDAKFFLLHTFFGRCFEFFVGISLALIYKNSQFIQSGTKPVRTMLGITWITLCLIALAAVRGNEMFGLHTPLGIVVNNFILPIGIALLFLGLITESSVFGAILGSRMFVLLGKSSYTFYLIHLGVISSFVFKYTHNTFIAFVVLNGIAVGLFKIIEEPCNKLLRNVDMYAFLSRWKRKILRIGQTPALSGESASS